MHRLNLRNRVFCRTVTELPEGRQYSLWRLCWSDQLPSLCSRLSTQVTMLLTPFHTEKKADGYGTVPGISCFLCHPSDVSEEYLSVSLSSARTILVTSQSAMLHFDRKHDWSKGYLKDLWGTLLILSVRALSLIIRLWGVWVDALIKSFIDFIIRCYWGR